MSDQIPNGGGDLLGMAKGLAGPFISAGFGLLMRWADTVEQGRCLSWRQILLDLPSVIGIGIMASGFAEWLGASSVVASGMAALGGWLGARGITDTILPYLAKRYRG